MKFSTSDELLAYCESQKAALNSRRITHDECSRRIHRACRAYKKDYYRREARELSQWLREHEHKSPIEIGPDGIGRYTDPEVVKRRKALWRNLMRQSRMEPRAFFRKLVRLFAKIHSQQLGEGGNHKCDTDLRKTQ